MRLAGVVATVAAGFGFAFASGAAPIAADEPEPWAPTIQCPADRIYHDVRDQGGRLESCTNTLPGAIVVRDGPARSWYGRDHLREEGRYESGRKTGRWRECDRFDRCRDHDYAVVESYERNHAVTSEVPVSYAAGKYVIDFGSCWSTSISRTADGATLDMTFSGGAIRCEVSYTTSLESEASTAAPPVSGQPAGPSSAGPIASGRGAVACQIPYAVGVRRFDSLDLRAELAKAGLPPFCRDPIPADDIRGDPPEQAFAIWVSQPIPGADGRETGRMRVLLANVRDVECASIARQTSGMEQLTVRLNKFAEQLVAERLGREDVKADACNGWLPLIPVDTMAGLKAGRTLSGRTLFDWALGPDPVSARHQRECLESQMDLKPTCEPTPAGGRKP